MPQESILKFKNKRVYLLMQQKNFGAYEKLIEKYLVSQGICVDIGSEFPVDPDEYDLVVPMNFPSILKLKSTSKNVIVFHTSDLPMGKGWAPIANIFLNQEPVYCLTSFVANSSVDSGDILMKIRFKVRGNDTARSIRKIDDHLMILGILVLLIRFLDKNYYGATQEGEEGTHFSKRTKEMNEVFLSQRLDEILPILRSVEAEHNCFLTINGYSFELILKPVIEPDFPTDIDLEFFDNRENYSLSSFFAHHDLDIEIPHRL
jgi:methionyl-tRNA formyltransferase